MEVLVLNVPSPLLNQRPFALVPQLTKQACPLGVSQSISENPSPLKSATPRAASQPPAESPLASATIPASAEAMLAPLGPNHSCIPAERPPPPIVPVRWIHIKSERPSPLRSPPARNS